MKEKNENWKIRDELRGIAPGLNEMKREDGCTTPHNYFKELPNRVFARIAEEKQRPIQAASWIRSLLKPRYAIALASVLILIVAGVWYSGVQKPANPLAEITEDEAIEYVLNNLHEFSNEDLISAGVLAKWDATEITPASDDVLDEILEDGELLEALF